MDGKFYGALTLRDLLITKKDEDLEEKIILSYPFVYDREEITDAAIDTLADYSEDSIPVLNKETGKIVGVITAADMVELINEEEEENRQAAVKKETEKKRPNIFGLLAFMLLLLLSLNMIFKVTPSNLYMELITVAAAAALELFDCLNSRKREKDGI